MKNNRSNYSTIKKAVIGVAILASSYLPMSAKAQDNYLAEVQPTKMEQITARAKDSIEKDANEGKFSGYAKNRYTSHPGLEFLWGVSRPLHLWNQTPDTGELQILPCYNIFSLDAFKAGGLFSPLEGLIATLHNQTLGRLTGKEMYNAFSDNPALTLGVLADYALMAVAAGGSSGGSGGGSSSDGSTDPANPTQPRDKPKPTDPVDPHDGSHGDL
ncbi:MAG: hypothetical protein Q8L27_02770 [archaeon]|nr:hypothetical protein [archaeon]